MRILIVADDPLARAGLAALIDGYEDCTVVARIGGGDGVAHEADLYQPDAILWDLGWDTDEDTLASLRSGLADLGDPDAGAVAVVAIITGEDAASAVWAVGVRGLLPRNADPQRISAALHAAAAGLISLDPSFTAGLLPATSPAPLSPPVEPLTPREHEVLQLLAEGLPNKGIARRLSISEHTVKFHVNAILSKLSAGSRTEAVVRATRAGLIAL